MADYLLKCGAVVQIDEDLREVFSKYSWRLTKLNYVCSKSKNAFIYMHRVAMSAGPGDIIDHIDGNPKNNQRENLRLTTCSLNQANQRKRAGGSSKHKGVYFVKRSGRWMAHIGVNQKRIGLGEHKTEDAAAHAYNKAAIFYFGESACLNPIGEDYEMSANIERGKA